MHGRCSTSPILESAPLEAACYPCQLRHERCPPHAAADKFLREVVGYLASAQAMLALPPGRPVERKDFTTQIMLRRIEDFLAGFTAPVSEEDVYRQQAFILRTIDVTVSLLQKKHARVVGEFWRARARLTIPR